MMSRTLLVDEDVLAELIRRAVQDAMIRALAAPKPSPAAIPPPPTPVAGEGAQTEVPSLPLSPPSPEPEAKPKKNGADPRFAVLRRVWEDEFQAKTNGDYRWQGPKDARALHGLLTVSPDDFRSKVRAGLRATGYAKATTVAQLAAKWNDITWAVPEKAYWPVDQNTRFSECEPWNQILIQAWKDGAREAVKWLSHYIVDARVLETEHGKQTLVLCIAGDPEFEYCKKHLHWIVKAAKERFALGVTFGKRNKEP